MKEAISTSMILRLVLIEAVLRPAKGSLKISFPFRLFDKYFLIPGTQVRDPDRRMYNLSGILIAICLCIP